LKELLQKTLLHEIPLTKALGLEVEEASSGLVRLRFPLEPNHNHKQTAFGGSLYSAAVLAGWSVAWCALQERGVKAQVVIAGSGERFLRGVTTDFVSECAAEPYQLEKALKMLATRGKARLGLASVVSCEGEACMAFQGTYGLIGL
jgi:thioesterase domain-containing protein